jgi:hypothetical protein
MSTPTDMWGISQNDEIEYLKLEIKSAEAALKDAITARDESLTKYKKACELRDKAREAYEKSLT